MEAQNGQMLTNTVRYEPEKHKGLLKANDEIVQQFLYAWYKNATQCGHGLDTPRAEDGRTFIQLFHGSSSHFMIDRRTEIVYSVSAYGQVNRKKPRGTVEFLTNLINKMTEKGEEYMHTYWYKLHPTN